MEAGLASLAGLLPPGIKQSLQQAIDNAPAAIKQAVEALPRDLQLVCRTPEGRVLLFATALLGVLLLASLLRPSGRAKRNTIVIAGPCNAGKTALFFQLTDGSAHNGSVASLAENASDARVAPPGGAGPARSVRLVDVPGHASMRDRLEQRLGEAAGVVFVLDSADVTPHRTEAADLLFEVLSHGEVQRRRLPVLIACNKADLDADAHSKEFVRKTLERQLDAMRKTRAAGIGKDAGGRVALGSPDKPFSFAGLRNRVVLAETSNILGQLDDVKEFVVSCL